jgi:hypothetical protein
MTTQVIFKMDKKLKEAAQAKAKKDGISLADIYKSATRSYIDGNLSIGLIYYGTLTPNTKTGRELMRARKDIKAGKNLSGPFKTSTEMDAYLDNLK